MASFRDAREFRGNQVENEEVNVIFVEPIAMIVPPELQDSPRTITSESGAGSSAGGGSDDHWPSTSSYSPTEETPSETEGAKEAGCSAPVMGTAAEVVLFERAALHHEVADDAAIVKRYKKLEEMYELALSQLTPNSIKFIIGFMLLCKRLEVPAKVVVFRSLFLYRLCPSTSGTRWYYISGREKMMIFTNIRNKVARWKRQFVFIRDTRIERINNELAARLSEWRTPNTYMNYPQLTVGEVNLKNRLLDYVKARGLVDLKALVTPEQIALLGFVDVANLHSEAYWRGSVREYKAQGTGELGLVPNVNLALTSSRLLHRGAAHSTEDSDAEDDVPLIRRRTSTGNQPAPAAAARPASVPQALAREVAKPAPASSSITGPRIAYPDGFSYVQTDCQAAMLQGMQSFVPLADRQRAKGHINYTIALFECEQGARAQNNELQQSCKQLASEKASLADEVSCLQSSEMANQVASAKSRADGLARKVSKLREELDRAQAEKESGIQAAKEEAGRAEDRRRPS
ncbi:hypothetical protein SLEP1_g15061 [Rubroshorea leprosula]|uniref:Transposase (putative) gypsy type domain-containing protein n=1 Tax=Rubroshorea leprosula TaxID=152421 RepID=A0AAV5IL71_9ROSI|nr:hypothetical protein SLEP1_g15061 [Rubroshorea leprosula]